MARYANKKYLAHVRSFPCLICGKPAQAHHLKMMYLAGMSVKVDDNWTVPLCLFCHDDLHRFGNEQLWWDMHGVDPVAWANEAWSKFDGES